MNWENYLYSMDPLIVFKLIKKIFSLVKCDLVILVIYSENQPNIFDSCISFEMLGFRDLNRFTYKQIKFWTSSSLKLINRVLSIKIVCIKQTFLYRFELVNNKILCSYLNDVIIKIHKVQYMLPTLSIFILPNLIKYLYVLGGELNLKTFFNGFWYKSIYI